MKRIRATSTYSKSRAALYFFHARRSNYWRRKNCRLMCGFFRLYEWSASTDAGYVDYSYPALRVYGVRHPLLMKVRFS